MYIKTKITRKILHDSYDTLVERAQEDLDFIFMTFAASSICFFGFKMDSASIIIGSMVVTPLMYPIISIGTGIFLRKWKVMFNGFLTVSKGIIFAILITMLLNTIFPAEQGSEVIIRLSASSIDYLFVAIFSGLAGTFAFFWPGVIESVVGIAIAVALIPPVVMFGIGLSSMNESLIAGSGTIILMNFAGIIIGSLLTVLGLHFFSKKI